MSYRVFCDRPAIELVDGKPVPPAAAAATQTSGGGGGGGGPANMDEESEEAEAEKVRRCFAAVGCVNIHFVARCSRAELTQPSASFLDHNY